jgi:transposase
VRIDLVRDDEKFRPHDADDNHQHHAQDKAEQLRAPPRRVEMIIGGDRRRRWSLEEKATITAASFEPGANVAAVAREYGVSQGLLHYWRRCARERVSDEQALRFVPVVTGDERQSAACSGKRLAVRVEIAGACVVIECGVDEQALRTVFSALRGSA